MSKHALHFLVLFLLAMPVPAQTASQPLGVCPPFPLRDETGAAINPMTGANATAAYSPKQTCGAKGCHDYDKITQGFHFTQGKGETMPAEYAARYNWVSNPGNYGGNWCSPAPLYRQLAPKKSTNARSIDMTSFDFVTATCGNCHPGGGPMEYDREGRRYDQRMSDPASGLVPGGDNGLDGDYYKARWSETGVIEADCLLCHMPEYDYKKRIAQLANLNFRWAATEGSGFGTVTGKVSAGEKPKAEYKRELFDENGNVLVHIAPAPRNDTCLNCHAKPDWKKRGASFSAHTDVHIARGLRCVDCHTSGRRASDARIRGKEIHQVGKGDDPSGWVRNDLDNTVRTCEACHAEGTLGAPIAKHSWLPPLHLEKVSCAACHIPSRYTKAALVQASDVFNGAPRITPPPKKIWTFYDQDMQFWNHYGELELFTAKDQPTDEFRPSLARYKGMIFPVDRVHSSWVGFEEPGKSGLNQLFMKDFYSMWLQHKNDPSKYPSLAQIRDDSGDGMIEINRPEEIDALLTATSAYLKATGFPMEGRRLVYLNDSRKYYSSSEFRDIPKEIFEATPYASVYKYSHNVLPAQAALGAKGCTDCHSSRSDFFYGKVLDTPFGADGKSVWAANYQMMELTGFSVGLGAFREEWMKPALYIILSLIAVLLLILGIREIGGRLLGFSEQRSKHITRYALTAGLIGWLVLIVQPKLLSYMTFDRFTLDQNHFWVSAIVLVIALWAALSSPRGIGGEAGMPGLLAQLQLWAAVCAGLAGLLMVLHLPWIELLNRYAYTLFDLSLVVMACNTILLLFVRLAVQKSLNR